MNSNDFTAADAKKIVADVQACIAGENLATYQMLIVKIREIAENGKTYLEHYRVYPKPVTDKLSRNGFDVTIISDNDQRDGEYTKISWE